jgi:Domain of unknown function (DUF1707)
MLQRVRNRSIRASDADREAVTGALRDHAVAGRLTTEELGERTGQALSARTLGELDALVADLPPQARRKPTTVRIASLLAEGVLWLLIGLILVTIAIVWAVVWTSARLATVAVRSLHSRHLPALRGGS